MGLEFHKQKEHYFQMQHENAATYVIPFIEEKYPLQPGMTVLEIGCAEGGVLKAFLDKGLQGMGIELHDYRAGLARGFLASYIEKGQAEIISKNIYDPTFSTTLVGRFDLIVLKDVVEHIPDQEKLLGHLKTYLKPNGQIYFGFPPWQMPFGGHQQIAVSKLGKMPWLHLLPRGLYAWVLRKLKEPEPVVIELLDCHDTGISIERFERCVRINGLKKTHKRLYLINPIYRYKFKLKPRVIWSLTGGIPWFRNFYVTCAYYLIGK